MCFVFVASPARNRVSVTKGYVGADGVFLVLIVFLGGRIRMFERCRNWNTDSLDTTYPVCEQKSTLAASTLKPQISQFKSPCWTKTLAETLTVFQLIFGFNMLAANVFFAHRQDT